MSASTTQCWDKIHEVIRAPFRWAQQAVSFLLDLVIEFFGAVHDASKKNDKSAIGILTFLATFSLTQGGALTLASQFTKKTSLLLAAYLALALVTVAGVLLVFRLTEWPDPSEDSAIEKDVTKTTTRYYFDYPTIRFARWTLGCTLLMPTMFVALVYYGFPVDVRKTMPSGSTLNFDRPISSGNAAALSFSGKLLDAEKHTQEVFLQWLGAGAAKPGKTLFLVRQSEPFAVDYYNFVVQIDDGNSAPESAYEDKLAFLVRDDQHGDGIESVLKQLHFRKEGGNTTNILDVRSPGAGERIVILVARKEEASLNSVKAHVR